VGCARPSLNVRALAGARGQFDAPAVEEAVELHLGAGVALGGVLVEGVEGDPEEDESPAQIHRQAGVGCAPDTTVLSTGDLGMLLGARAQRR